MKREAFDLLRTLEHSWWYQGRVFAIRAALARARVHAPLDSILDFGAGYGGMYAELARFGRQIYAFEPDVDARAAAARRGYAAAYEDVGEALSRPYELIGVFDVIEHIENDEEFLRSLRKALLPGGLLAVTVPASPWLWNAHDIAHQHFRRYTKRALSACLSRAGYEIAAVNYWNSIFFIPAALVRFFGGSGSSALDVPRWVDALLRGIVAFEAKVARFLPLPFGVSLVAIARKKSDV